MGASSLTIQTVDTSNTSSGTYSNAPVQSFHYDYLNLLPKKQSLFETVLVASNDTLVDLFLNKKISFNQIQKLLFKIINLNEFKKFKKIIPAKITDIIKLNKYVRLKILKKVYKSTNV